MAEKKEKQYVSDNAQLMAEWDWERNIDFDPSQITHSSGKKVWWKCQKGHVWQAVIANRNKGIGCPFCSGQRAIRGENDLATINPSLSSEWNYRKNNGLTPSDVMANSGKKVWWKCQRGHEWLATIDSRNKGIGCPFCSGRNAINGETDLQTVNPTLAKEWNYKKNGTLKPEDFTAHSGKKIWWKCQEEHEWQATINSRASGKGCPYCSNKKILQGHNDLTTLNPSLAKEWNYEKNGNLTPDSFTTGSGKKVWWKCNKGHEWLTSIYDRNNGSGCPICSSERNTSLPEYAIIYYLKKYGLEAIHSYKELGYELDVYIPSKKIAIEYDGAFWHENRVKKDLEKNQKCKNNGIILYRFREEMSSLNDSSIDYFVQRKQKNLSQVLEKVLSEIIGISIDVNLERDAIEIENLREYKEKATSVLLSNPEIAKEWNYEKNGNLKPENFSVNSNKKVWWRCNKGHEWQATVSNRTNGTGCPYCSNKKILQGYNDLLTVNPTLAIEWNCEKNKDLKPEHFTASSGKKVWWICQKGHEWQATIANRTIGRGCPYCSGKKVMESYNDLQALNPNLAKEWNYEKNEGLKPEEFTANSGKKVWWKCIKGHEWEATIASRNYGRGCPYCSGRKKTT